MMFHYHGNDALLRINIPVPDGRRNGRKEGEEGMAGWCKESDLTINSAKATGRRFWAEFDAWSGWKMLEKWATLT